LDSWLWLVELVVLPQQIVVGSSWLEEAELLVMTRVSSITSFADIISVLVKEMVTLTTDKVLCIVCNEGGCTPKVS